MVAAVVAAERFPHAIHGYTSTIKMNFNYVAGSGQVIQTSQGMSPTDILVATFTTPALSAR